jgi:hypothetical protein
MSDRLIAVQLVQHQDRMLDGQGGLAIFANGTGLRVALPPEEARELARRLDVVADQREAAEAVVAGRA